MQEIKCPKCGEDFQIDEAGYAEIVKQVRNREFNDELQRQKLALDNEKKMAVELAVTKANSQKDDEIARLKNQLEARNAELNSAKSARISFQWTRIHTSSIRRSSLLSFSRSSTTAI